MPKTKLSNLGVVTIRNKKRQTLWMCICVCLCYHSVVYFSCLCHVCFDLCLFAHVFIDLSVWGCFGHIHHALFRRGYDQCIWALGRLEGVINIFHVRFSKPRIVSPRGSLLVSLWSQYIVHKHLNRQANQKRLPPRENAWLALTTTENKST